MIQTSTKYVNDIIKYGLTRKKYEVLDEIHATQSFTYIDTGVYCTSDISVEVKYKSETSHNSGYPHVFAGNAEWNDSQSFHVYYHLGELAYKFIGETDQHYTGIYTDTNEHIIHMSSTEITFDGTVLGTQQDPHISGSKNLLLLSKRPTQLNEQGFFPIYYFKVWNGSTLIRDLIPVKRLSDDAIGMYDRVNNVFYGSATSNSFSYTSLQTPEYITEFDNTEYHINRIYLNGELYWGGDTPAFVPTYELLEEIHASTMWTYINTGVILSSNISAEIGYQCNKNYDNVYPRLFAGDQNWDSSYTMYVYYHLGVLCYKFLGLTSNTQVPSITTDNNNHVIYMSSTELRYDGNVVGTRSNISMSTNTELRLFAPNTNSGYPEQGYYPTYYFKVWDSGVLIRDMVPVKRLSDNAIGMYDKKNDQFYQSMTSNTIAYTPKSPPEYI